MIPFSLTVETWTDCPGFPGYSISSQGRVLSRRTGRIKAAYLAEGSRRPGSIRQRCQYWKIDLYASGKQYKRRVCRLVCEAFHGPPPSPKHIALHGPAGSLVDRAENLRWGTYLENNLDTIRDGNHRGFCGVGG